MKRQPFNLCAAIALVALCAGCSRAQPTATITPIVPPSPYDGIWDGSGESGGTAVSLSVTVQGGSVTGISYSFPGKDGLKCSNLNYSPITGIPHPEVVDGVFTAELGKDATISATIAGDTASGHFKIVWDDRYENCNGTYEGDWTGKKR